MNPTDHKPADPTQRHLAYLEQRLAAVELHLGIKPELPHDDEPENPVDPWDELRAVAQTHPMFTDAVYRVNAGQAPRITVPLPMIPGMDDAVILIERSNDRHTRWYTALCTGGVAYDRRRDGRHHHTVGDVVARVAAAYMDRLPVVRIPADTTRIVINTATGAVVVTTDPA